MNHPPDDPRWLSAPADLRVMDATVLRQVGIPEAIIVLATRSGVADPAGVEHRSGLTVRGIPFQWDDQPEADPYWQDEYSCRDYRRW